ncbi:hypothetical protein LAZ67_21001467 [Cordylochernes scorpioides]|uniref:SCAN domain-containing protein 3 n=1 Tax=Cordylochernes scorpioides TaxID=51811 RepID=A0ABY6LN21_9ARAC|nr:hypothetical protein LAZ67_21001467 [Cordylochernes scorpioides]
MERFLIREGASDKQNQNENKEDKKIVKSTGNKRKYVEDYLKYGFIPSVNDPSLPFCLICQKTLSNETMLPSKLLRHIETNHREQMNNPISYFENIRSSFQKQSKKFKKFMTTSDEAQTASYMIAQLIARKKKAHAEAEEIILPALKIVAGCMLTNDAMEKVTKIPLSSKTIARRIEDMSEDIELQIKQSFNDSSTKWAKQLDETTDISNKAQLLAFLRFVDTGKIVNNYFFCKELKQRTTGADIFELVDENVMNYERFKKGIDSTCHKKNPNIKFVHCMIHREMLVSKSVSPILVTTLDEVVKVVNYIKSNALRSRIFSTFCEAMDSDYKNVLFHTEVRWLSKGKVLNRFISMKNEIMAFIDNEEINFPFMMSDVWWLRVSFLGDIFDKLNSLNLNLQGAQENIITISTKLKAFKEKLSLWSLNIAKVNFASFPMVQENPSKSIIKKEVEETLTLLSASFDKYFPYLDVEKMEWVVNPFMHCEIQHLEEEMQENLIDLKNDLVFKRLFTEKELSEFWLCLNSKFPKLCNAAIESLLPFGSSYLCEQGFSTLTEMKSKKRERLQMIDEEMRVCLSQCTDRSDRFHGHDITTINPKEDIHTDKAPQLADIELGESPDSGMCIVDLKDLILKSSAYDEEFVKNMLTNIIEERKDKEQFLLKKQRSEEDLKIDNFDKLKDLIITEQIKKRTSSEMRDYFFEDWFAWVTPSHLAVKLDVYDYLRKIKYMSLNNNRNAHEKRKEIYRGSLNKRNDKAMVIISTAIVFKQLEHLITCDTAQKQWTRLKSIYEQRSTTSLLAIQQQFYSYKMNEKDAMSKHISKIEGLIKQLCELGEKVSKAAFMAKVLGSLPSKYAHFLTAWDSVTQTEQTKENLIARLL